MASEYTQFLADSKVKVDIHRKGTTLGFPNELTDTLKRNVYTVTLQRKGRSYTFQFTDSHYNWERGILPTPEDILSTLTVYEPPDDTWDFAEEYGYKISDKESYCRVQSIAAACRNEYKQVSWVLGDEWMEKLREIS